MPRSADPVHQYPLRLALADLAARDASLAPMTIESVLAHPHWGLVLLVHARKFSHCRATGLTHK